MNTRAATERQLSEGDCPLDNIPIRQHVRCCICTILIGPIHYARHAIERAGAIYCAECAERTNDDSRRHVSDTRG